MKCNFLLREENKLSKPKLAFMSSIIFLHSVIQSSKNWIINLNKTHPDCMAQDRRALHQVFKPPRMSTTKHQWYRWGEVPRSVLKDNTHLTACSPCCRLARDKVSAASSANYGAASFFRLWESSSHPPHASTNNMFCFVLPTTFLSCGDQIRVKSRVNVRLTSSGEPKHNHKSTLYRLDVYTDNCLLARCSTSIRDMWSVYWWWAVQPTS